MRETKTVAIIGAGPVGLAAAAHVLERGLKPIVLEAGDDIAHSVRQWGHVQLFSPWEYNIDRAERVFWHRRVGILPSPANTRPALRWLSDISNPSPPKHLSQPTFTLAAALPISAAPVSTS